MSPSAAPPRTALLRAARPEDADAVARVLIESRRAFVAFAPMAHSERDVQSWVRSSLVPAGRCVVCEHEGSVVGILGTSVSAGVGWIDQLYLLPGHTGRGLGTGLLRHAHEVLPRPIRLYTFQANAGARRFYARHGYEPIAFSDGRDNEERCPDVLLELAT